MPGKPGKLRSFSRTALVLLTAPLGMIGVTLFLLVFRVPFGFVAMLGAIALSRSAFFGPMAVAIMGGLIVATALTLLFLPALYAAWFRVPSPPDKPARGATGPVAFDSTQA